MTGVAEKPASSRPLFSSRRVVVIVAVAAVGLAAWLGMAWHGRSQVEVVAAEPLLTCRGTEVIVEEAIGDSEVQIPYAVVSERMRCRVRFQVRNRGWLPVEVRSVSVPMYGPDSGTWVLATAMEPFQAAPRPAGQPSQPDAVFVPDEPFRLRGGETAEFAVDLVYRPPGCQAGVRGWSSVPDSPVVRVSVLGVPGDRKLAGDSFGLKCVRR